MENQRQRHCTGDAIKLNLHERKRYAGHRALLAIDRASHEPLQERRDNAFRWMQRWMAFAASRHPAFVKSAVKPV